MKMLEWLTKKIMELIPWKNIVEFLSVLIKHQKAALVLCLSLMVGSISLVVWYWQRSADYDDIVRNTMSADMERTPQRFKGLEAFIYSNLNQNIDETIDVNKAVKSRQLSEKFVKQCDLLEAKLNEFMNPAVQQAAMNEVQLKVVGGASEGKILSDGDNSKPGFLFLPVYVLRPTLTNQDFEILKNGKVPESVSTAFNTDTNLKRDVALSGFLASELQEFTKKQVFESNNDSDNNDKLSKFVNSDPTQVYLITKNGVNRIFSNKGEHPEQLYGTQFSATTFFPSRPYFWPVFQEPQFSGKNFMPGDRNVGNYFYITRPYIDLAGNGMVLTLARGLLIDGVVQAVLCFDLQFVPSNSIDTSLRRRIAKLEGTSVQVICEIFQEGNVDCRPDVRAEHAPPNEVQNDLVQDLVKYIKKHSAARERAEVAGNIAVINEEATGDELHFSVPIAEAGYDANRQTTTLLLVSFNVIKFKNFTSLIGALAALSFAMVLLLLTYFWARTIRSQKEYEESFEQVGKVMFKSPTPYVRLSSDDFIKDCSLSFCEKLGYPPTRESVRTLKQKKFEDLVVEDEEGEHLQTYQEVQKLRRARRPVTPYVLKMRTRDDSTIDVTVRSAAIPSRESGMPETFGILLDMDVKNTTSLTPTTQVGSPSSPESL